MFKEDVIKNKIKKDLEKKHSKNILTLRNRFLAEWASNILGLKGKNITFYVKKLKKKASNHIIKKIENDFIENNIKISNTEINIKLNEFQMKANIIAENKLKLDNWIK